MRMLIICSAAAFVTCTILFAGICIGIFAVVGDTPTYTRAGFACFDNNGEITTGDTFHECFPVYRKL